MSDINRKFYPIAFAFSSHEQNEDFRKIFINLTKIIMKLKVDIKGVCCKRSRPRKSVYTLFLLLQTPQLVEICFLSYLLN